MVLLEDTKKEKRKREKNYKGKRLFERFSCKKALFWYNQESLKVARANINNKLASDKRRLKKVTKKPKKIMSEGYCVKCREKREMENEEEVEMNGKGGVKRRALKGKCPSCGTKMFKILGKAK